MGTMYGIFTYIYHKNQPTVGKYHGNLRAPPYATPPENKALLRDY